VFIPEISACCMGTEISKLGRRSGTPGMGMSLILSSAEQSVSSSSAWMEATASDPLGARDGGHELPGLEDLVAIDLCLPGLHGGRVDVPAGLERADVERVLHLVLHELHLDAPVHGDAGLDADLLLPREEGDLRLQRGAQVPSRGAGELVREDVAVL